MLRKGDDQVQRFEQSDVKFIDLPVSSDPRNSMYSQQSFDYRSYRPSVDSQDDQRQKKRLSLNISGLKVECDKKLFREYPDTLLGDEQRLLKYYEPDTGEYFFNRHQLAFHAVLYFYQSKGKILTRPPNITEDVFKAEIEFWGVNHASTRLARKATLGSRNLLVSVAGQPNDEKNTLQLCSNKEAIPGSIRARAWIFLQDPGSSKGAKYFSMLKFYA